MPNALLDNPGLQTPKPWWQPLFSLLITMYGIVFQGWGMSSVVFLFWWEIILMVGAALVRVVFAMEGRPVWETVVKKLGVLIFGVVMGGAMIMLAITFSINGFNSSDGSLGDIVTQSRLLIGSYLLGLVFHYFSNGRFRTADVFGELMLPLVQLLILLALLMPITMHLLPKYPQLNQARYVAVAVVLVKFVVDSIFSRYKAEVKEIQTF
ncbi:MAG: hypothetical protein IT270_05315 [Saprospiraceae bacterium]|nr:hypothetical protein [Saprospiraceae bacterium]